MKYFIIVACLLSSLHCTSQKKEVIAKSTIKLEGKETSIRDVLEIDGYYSNQEYPYSGAIFFEDGTWVAFSFNRDIPINEINSNISQSIVSWIEDQQLRWGTYWGVYTIKSDTIIVYSYVKGSFWKGWSLNESRYKIIDRKTIMGIYSRSILKSADDYFKTHSPWINRNNESFIPADSLPPSDCWLKEEKWIWRHEADWKEYMQRVKQIKEKKK
jgi:hypothetical protein